MATDRERGRASDQRVLYINLQNEEVVLATMIHDPKVRLELSTKLTTDHFTEHRKIVFTALQRMARARLAWSEDTFFDLAGSDDEAFGGWRYIRTLEEDYKPNANIDHHVERMKIDSTAYSISQSVGDLLELLGDNANRNPRAIARWLRTQAERMEQLERSFAKTGSDFYQSWISGQNVRAAGRSVGERTYLPLLDQHTPLGLYPGLSILAGRPGHGKTTLLADILRRRANAERKSFIAAWEMEPGQYIDKMAASEAGVLTNDIVLSPNKFDRETREAIKGHVLRFTEFLIGEENPFPHLSPTERNAPWERLDRNMRHVENTVRRYRRDCAFFAFDVFGECLPDSKQETFKDALIRAKALAIETQVHIMLVVHINREGATGRPTLETLKGSGELEQRADYVFAAEQPRLRAGGEASRRYQRVMDLHLLKQRHGAFPLCFRYNFDGAKARIGDERLVDAAALEREERAGAEREEP